MAASYFIGSYGAENLTVTSDLWCGQRPRACGSESGSVRFQVRAVAVLGSAYTASKKISPNVPF